MYYTKLLKRKLKRNNAHLEIVQGTSGCKCLIRQ